VSFALTTSQHFDLGYTFIHANPPATGLISEYAYNFAAQSASFSYAAVIRHQLSARTQLGVMQKTTHSPYSLWNVALSRSQGFVRPYLMLNNLSNTTYYEVSGPPAVPMPGRSFIAGMLVTWGTAR
jgi:iron complex outermembrane receptor protein